MDNVTKDWLNERINIIFKEIKNCGLEDIEGIAENFNFENRKLVHPEECEVFYKSGKFCHNGTSKEKYCLLCSCNYYDTNSEIGGCKIGNPQREGRPYNRTPFDNYGNPRSEEIWDCGNCNYPHTKNATIRILNKIKKERESSGECLKKILRDIFIGN